jgi:hypothetical protein
MNRKYVEDYSTNFYLETAANSKQAIRKRTIRATQMFGLAPMNFFFLRRISPLMDCWQMGKINNFMFALHRKKGRGIIKPIYPYASWQER